METPDQPLVLNRRDRAPGLQPGGARARVILSEVCGTDVHRWHGRLAGVPYPIVPGHVNLVEILDTSGEIRDVEGRRIEAGTIATFYDVHGTCGSCWQCLVARSPTRCPHRRV